MNEILFIKGLVKNFNGVKALADFSCSVRRGEILGLIGPNGAGKTTLFNAISGFVRCDNGKVVFKEIEITKYPPHRITNFGISRTFQNLRLIHQITVLENVLLSFKQQHGERLRNVFFKWRLCQIRENENRDEVLVLLEQVGLAEKAYSRADELSYGEQKLLTLVCCLAAKSELLLLDEPVAGIAPAMTDRVLNTISGLPAEAKSVILIEHNLDAVIQVCDRVIFMDAGTKVIEGTPDDVRNDPRAIEAYID